MKYRKKPVTVNAFQLGVDPFPFWFIDRVDKGEIILNEGPSALINTLEGTMHAGVNDFIIMGVFGEIYPCKPDIFLETYEPVTETKRVTKRELLERMRKINAEREKRIEASKNDVINSENSRKSLQAIIRERYGSGAVNYFYEKEIGDNT